MPLVFRKITLFSLLIGCCTSLWSQDIHFTDFRAARVQFNPSLNGTFEGTYRISGIYRDQWRNISNSSPYKTAFISAEVNIKAGLLLENDWISAGLSFFNDKSGTLGFKQQLTGLNVGYHIGTDDEYKNVFSIGFNYGGGSTGFNVNELTTPNRLLTGSNGETFAADPEGNLNRSYSDFAIGISYKSQLNDGGDLVRFGIAGAHFLAPNVSLAPSGGGINPPNPPNPPNPNPGGRMVGLDTRISVIGEASFMTTDKIRINPALLAQFKSGSNEIQVQGTADYLLSAKNRTIVSAGLGYRLGDSFGLLAGIQLKDLRIGIAYDITTSNLREAGDGAFELSVGYVGRIFKTPNVDPVIFCPRL